MEHRAAVRGPPRDQRTTNPHLTVTKGTKAGRNATSVAHVSRVLDSARIAPWMLRSTRLIDLVTMDAKLVTAAFGMRPEAVMIYLADHVDPNRLPAPSSADRPG